jgi:hypothetical protein
VKPIGLIFGATRGDAGGEVLGAVLIDEFATGDWSEPTKSGTSATG